MGPKSNHKYNWRFLRRAYRNHRHYAWFKGLRGVCRRAWNRIVRRDGRREIAAATDDR